ncbi:MAG: gamma-glutamyltransferase family protein [Gammaproteobacteria bacterium]
MRRFVATVAACDPMLDRSALREDPGSWSAADAGGMAVAAHYLAAEAGAEMLRAGGNAFDAAIAVSLALAVCESAGSGLGGMGIALGFDARAQRAFTVEGPCRAPRAASPERVAATDRYRGYAAAATPGLCAALGHLQRRYASLPAAMLFEPAIALASGGFAVTRLQHELAGKYRRALTRGNAAELFLPGGEPRAAGERFVQADLAQSLVRLRDAGFADFYHGEIARAIAADMRAHGGFVDAGDLAAMTALEEREPLQIAFDGATALTVGPPAGGLALAQLLGCADRLPHAALDLATPRGVVGVARTIRRVRRDRIRMRLKVRAEEPGEAALLLSDEHLAACIDAIAPPPGETSHFCTADAAGNWVAMTQSIERSFGAGCVTAGLGFLHNGYLRAFKVENERHPYFLRPGCAARSNAAPTLLVRDGRPTLAVGSTGSERMQSGIFEVLLRLRRESAFAAVAAPRLHATPDGQVLLEQGRFPRECVAALTAAGYDVLDQGEWAFSMGGLQLLLHERSGFCGVSEPRRDGAARGPGVS